MSRLPDRMPWGFRHIAAILVLSVVGWIVIVLPVVVLVTRHSARHMVSFDDGLFLTALLYAVLYAAIVLVIRRVGGWRRLGYFFPGWPTLLVVVVLMPVWFALMQVVGVASEYVLNHGKPLQSNVTELFGPAGLRGIGPTQIVLAILLVGVVVPVVEETLFRGVLYQWLRGLLGVGPAAPISAGVFAAAHLLGGAQTIWKLLPVLFIMGLVLALTFQRTRSLYASMLLHGANNVLAIIVTVAPVLGK